MNKVVVIAKFFRNHHSPHECRMATSNARVNKASTSQSCNTRWESCLNTLEWILKNWQILRAITAQESHFFRKSEQSTCYEVYQ